jgi:hypothetical protein
MIVKIHGFSLREKIQVCSKNHRLRVLFFACTIEKKWTNNSTVFLQQWPQSWPVSSKTPFMICVVEKHADKYIRQNLKFVQIVVKPIIIVENANVKIKILFQKAIDENG